MFKLDTWQEILVTLRRNKLRTALTAFSVAWGIFMLVILLGTGTGLQRGIEHDFRDDAVNSIWIRGGRTSIPYQGRAPGREINFNNQDYDALRREIPEIEHITGRFYLWGDFTVSYGDRATRFDIRGTHPDHRYLERTRIVSGRFLNEFDVSQKRKIAIIGPEVSDFLFRGANPIGEFINIRGVNYKVAGIYDDEGSQGERRKIYIPISTAQLVYGGKDRVHALMFTIGDATVEQSKRVEDRARHLLNQRHAVAPSDERALRINNNLERFQKISDIFKWLEVFVWIVGCGTVMAGIVGVSNIMFISVKERTKEMGVRKAIGATPASIIGLIMREAISITATAGYLGLISGVLLIEALRKFVPENDYIREPEVNLAAALSATALIIVAGALAGFFPARTAARVNPVVALRGGA